MSLLGVVDLCDWANFFYEHLDAYGSEIDRDHDVAPERRNDRCEIFTEWDTECCRCADDEACKQSRDHDECKHAGDTRPAQVDVNFALRNHEPEAHCGEQEEAEEDPLQSSALEPPEEKPADLSADGCPDSNGECSGRLQSLLGDVDAGEFQCLGWAVSGCTIFLSDVGFACQSQDGDRQVPKGGHDVGCLTCSDLAVAFAPNDIAAPAQSIFDSPVAMDPGTDLGGFRLR